MVDKNKKIERLAKDGLKKCKDCLQVKDYEEFQKHKNFSDGHNSRCKSCEKERLRLIQVGFIESGQQSEKECIRCKVVQRIRCFKKSSAQKSGRHNVCAKCQRKQADERRKKNQDKIDNPDKYSKSCKYCRRELKLTEFHKKNTSSDGRGARCASCSRKDMKRARASRPEHYRELQRESYKRNKERYREIRRARYQKNREKNLQEKAEYRRKHPEKVAASKKESAAKMRKLPWWRARQIWYVKKAHCENRGIEFGLTLEWVTERYERGVCEVTGLPFDFESSRGPFGPSLDKIDPAKGYTEDNTQVVVWAYNAAKGRWTAEDVLTLAHALVAKDLEGD